MTSLYNHLQHRDIIPAKLTGAPPETIEAKVIFSGIDFTNPYA